MQRSSCSFDVNQDASTMEKQIHSLVIIISIIIYAFLHSGKQIFNNLIIALKILPNMDFKKVILHKKLCMYMYLYT